MISEEEEARRGELIAFVKENSMRLKVWILVWAIICGGLLLLVNFVAVILYIALYVWK